MEVPRLDHALSSPSSPCEEIKNLSLEAIQLCDRDGKAPAGDKRTRGGGGPVPGRGRLSGPREKAARGKRAPLGSAGEGNRGERDPMGPRRGLPWEEGAVRIRGRMLLLVERAPLGSAARCCLVRSGQVLDLPGHREG